jgi:hypothetical protein
MNCFGRLLSIFNLRRYILAIQGLARWPWSESELVHGRGLHSSTSLRNLSRFCHRNQPSTTIHGTRSAHVELNVDESKPLVHGGSDSEWAGACRAMVKDASIACIEREATCMDREGRFECAIDLWLSIRFDANKAAAAAAAEAAARQPRLSRVRSTSMIVASGADLDECWKAWNMVGRCRLTPG